MIDLRKIYFQKTHFIPNHLPDSKRQQTTTVDYKRFCFVPRNDERLGLDKGCIFAAKNYLYYGNRKRKRDCALST